METSISEVMLDVLCERVCRPIRYLSTSINASTPLWDEPLKMCEQIENNLFAVDSVIVKAKSIRGEFNGTNAPYIYQAILSRVYILLYYTHRDEELYQEIVFPRLRENMGIFNTVHLKSINEQIDKIISQEKLVEKVMNAKKDVKPMFAYVKHSRPQMDRLFDEYSEEPLFCKMIEVIRYMSDEYGTELDEANVWFNAKRVVQEMGKVRRPEMFIERAVTSLVEGQKYSVYDGSQEILLCVYAMVRVSKKDTHFDKFIAKMESIAYPPTDLYVIQRNIGTVKALVEENGPFECFDYIGERPDKVETFTREDIVRLSTNYKEQLEAKGRELEELRAKLKESQCEEVEEIEWHDKVRLELTLRLLEKEGVDLSKVVKSRVAEVMQTITRLPIQTCKNYCTNRDLNVKKHDEEILKLNTRMQAIGMEIRL